MSKSNRKLVLSPATWKLATQCVQGGFVPTVGGPRVLPIFQSTTYKYEDLDQVERLFALKEAGFKYTRTGNPSLSAFEQKMTLLEGGVGAVSVASGQAATLLSAINLCKAGDHIVSAATVYGGTYTLFGHTLKKFGLEATFVDPEAPVKELRKAFRPNTRLLFAETIGNPALGILDFDKFSLLARTFDVPFIVDNTLATPYLCKPVTSFCSIGTGSGLDVLAAIEALGSTRMGLTDVHEDVVKTAVQNIRRNIRVDHPLVVQAGFGDLLKPLQQFRPTYDLIYENLPNVPLRSAKKIAKARTSSTCLAPRKERIPTLVKSQMLDLHYLALLQAKDFLFQGGMVLSTLGGRVPLDVLLSLGKLAGYKASFLTYTWKVQADPCEVIFSHAQKQQQGLGPFYFYRAEALQVAFGRIALEESGEKALAIERSLLPKRLDAVQAYAALQTGEAIGHTVAVLRSEKV